MKSIPLILTTLGFLLSSCATQPTKDAEAVPIPTSRIFASEFLNAEASRNATIVVTRDKGHTAQWTSVLLYLDGKKVAEIKPREQLVLHVPAGKHLLAVQFSWGPRNLAEKEFTVESGATKRWRISADQNANLDIRDDSGNQYGRE